MTKEEQEFVNNFLFAIVRGEHIFLMKQEDGSHKTAITVENILAEFSKLKKNLDG